MNCTNICDCGETTKLFPYSPRSYNSARSLVRTATLAAGQGRTETMGTPLEYRRQEVTEVS